MYPRTARLDRYVATTGDLGRGASWEFDVVLLEFLTEIDSYDLAALGLPA